MLKDINYFQCCKKYIWRKIICDKSYKNRSRARIHLFQVIHFATADYHSRISGLLDGRRFRLRWSMTVRVSTWYSWYYTVCETFGSQSAPGYTNRSHALAVSRGHLNHTASDYEILSQHFVRLIRPDSWVIPDRSVIQIFKEIHALTHLVPPTTRTLLCVLYIAKSYYWLFWFSISVKKCFS